MYLITEWNPSVLPPYTPYDLNDTRFGSELTYLALARYQLVAHPNNPSRLGNIFNLVHDLEKVVNHTLIISLFFNNDAYGVVSFINNVIIPYNTTANNVFIDSTLFVNKKT